jgi:hypothetical protein
MIKNDVELQQTIDQLARMYEILAGLHAKIAPHNFKNYLLYSEGPMDYVVRLRREIDEYLGLDEGAVLQMQREMAEADALREAAEKAAPQPRAAKTA